MSAERASTAQVFGQLLRELRLERGLSQERLAHESGMHRTSIGLFERGENGPSLDSVFALAGALDISASQIVRRMETAPEA